MSLKTNVTTSMLLLSGMVLAVSGCATNAPTMRGQSPNAQFASWDGGQGHGGPNHECPMCDSGFPAAGMPMNGMATNCDSGMCPPGKMSARDRRAMKRACRNPGCHSCGGVGCDQCINLPFHPVHRNFHTYQTPQGLSYPQQDTPAAMYQYPYYTFRGPTDFFQK